jgi:hypothetical protein
MIFADHTFVKIKERIIPIRHPDQGLIPDGGIIDIFQAVKRRSAYFLPDGSRKLRWKIGGWFAGMGVHGFCDL